MNFRYEIVHENEKNTGSIRDLQVGKEMYVLPHIDYTANEE